MGQVKEIHESMETSFKRQGSESNVMNESKIHTLIDLDSLEYKSEYVNKNYI